MRLSMRVRPHARDIRWVPEENLHITLQFLGDLDDRELVEVCEQVDQAVRGCEPFTVEVQGIGAFPSVERPRTLWVGIAQDEGRDQLIELQAAVDQSLAEVGHRGENRKYVPHVTIGKSGRGPGGRNEGLSEKLIELAAVAAGTTAPSTVTEVLVYSSELHRDGPEYMVLARCPLGV